MEKSIDKSYASSTSSLSNCDSLQTSSAKTNNSLTTSNFVDSKKLYNINHSASNESILSDKFSQKRSKNKTITTLEELQNMKPGSRQPVDIANFNGDLKVSSPTTNCTKATKISPKHTIMSSNDRLSDYEIIRRLKNLSKTTHATQKTKIVLPTHNDQTENNRKYFSFMTTNKEFNEIAQRQTFDQKYNKQPKQELEDSALLKSTELSFKRQNNRYSSSSSSSTTSSGSDSGCGSSVNNRTSILSECNEFQQDEANISNYSPLSSTFGPVQNLCDNTYFNENVKSLCGKIFTRNDTSKNSQRSSPSCEKDQSVSRVCGKKSTKFVTILFDYETTCRSFNGVQSKFCVKKGQRAKVLRDYERDLLVATETDSQIGFVPKDYTVDLKEVEERFKLNCQKSFQPGQSFYNSETYMRLPDDYENSKLTHL